MDSNKFFFSEGVLPGHPDKLADQIADCVVDAYLKKDRFSKVACEVLLQKTCVTVTLEVSSSVTLSIEKIVTKKLKSLACEIPKVHVLWQPQSTELSSIARSNTLVASDQAIVFGYATNKTQQMLPWEHVAIYKGVDALCSIISSRPELGLHTDGKLLATGKNGVIDHWFLSVSHDLAIPIEEVRNAVEQLFRQQMQLETQQTVTMNPAGPFTCFGPEADTGVTGRKVIFDTYGPSIPCGGGSLSGKDLTKIDRLGAYFARWLAKQLVWEGHFASVVVSVVFVIGKAMPEMILLNGKENKALLKKYPQTLHEVFTLLELGAFKACETLSYRGHFGRPDLPWEACKVP